MAKNKSSTQKSGGVKPGPGGGAAFRVTGFPKEFERNIWEDLDKRLRYAVWAIEEDVMQNEQRNLLRRMRACVRMDGGHFEHLL